MPDPRIAPTNTNARHNMASGRQASARSTAGQAMRSPGQPVRDPGQAARTVGRMSDPGIVRNGMDQIRQGDIIRGEISDLHNNEITVTLENNTVIRGQIADSSSLSIGQTAAFRLNSISSSGLLMEAIPNSYTETELTLIHKALDEAGLPYTERNQSAVKALMDNLLPISKQSIQQLMQQAYDLNTEDMQSLCLMNRRHLTVTADSAAQFSAYRNASHQLLGRMQTFAAQLPQLLSALSENGPSRSVAAFGEQLLGIALSSPAEPHPAAIPAPTVSDLPLADQDTLRSILANTPLTDEQLRSIQDGTMTQREALTLLRDAMTQHTAVLPQNCPAGEISAKADEIMQLLRPLPSDAIHAVGQTLTLSGAEPQMATLQDIGLQDTGGRYQEDIAGQMAQDPSGRHTGDIAGQQADALSGQQTGDAAGRQADALSGQQTGDAAGRQTDTPSSQQAGNIAGQQTDTLSSQQAGDAAGRRTDALSGQQTGDIAGQQTGKLSEQQMGRSSGQQAGEASPDPSLEKDTSGQPGSAEKTAAKENASAFSLAGRFFHNITDTARSSIRNLNQNINQLLTAPRESSPADTHTPPVIDTLLDNVTGYGREQSALFTFLDTPERMALADLLQNISVSQELQERVLTGEAATREVFSAIHSAIPQADSFDVQHFFQTEVFQKLFTQNLMENFTITPKQLAKNGEMDSFYQGVESQMDSFEKLIRSTLSGNDSQQLSQQAHDAKSNIDFMKALNEAFGYMQMPLKLRDQNAHGDLYVYTKKDSLKQNKEQVSLLLHLEMEHLGTVNVRLEKESQNIKAVFHLDNEDALQLISRNTHMLKDSLHEKGYTCQIQVQPMEKPETPVQDFLNQKVSTAATKEMKRFSFDIRA